MSVYKVMLVQVIVKNLLFIIFKLIGMKQKKINMLILEVKKNEP